MECSVVITGNYPSEPERKTESTVVFDLPKFAFEKRVNGNVEEVSCFGKACHFELERNAGQKALKFFSLFGRIGSMEEELEPLKSKKSAACALGSLSFWGGLCCLVFWLQSSLLSGRAKPAIFAITSIGHIGRVGMLLIYGWLRPRVFFCVSFENEIRAA